MKKKLKFFISFLLICLFINVPSVSIDTETEKIYYSQVVLADETTDESDLEIQTQPPTDDTQEIYNRYKDNSFSLMNKEFSGINKINQFMQNFFLTIKNFLFGAVVFIGKFNVMLVNSLFNLNIANAIKEPIQQMSLVISNNMIGIASTIGVLVIAIFMIVKLISTGQTGQAVKVFFIGLLSFIVLTAYNNPTTNKYFFDGIIEVDNQIENAFAGINPQFSDNDSEADSVGEKIGADVFRTNIYEPYLYFNYGTTDTTEIRKKTVEYKGKEYERIGALLDNDSSSEKQIKFIEKVTDYEVDDLKNNSPSYKSASAQSFTAIAYLITNIIQTLIFGALGMIRLALQFLLIIIPLFLPIIMIVGMVLNGTSLLGNFFKGFMTISFLKASLSFITVIFTNYVSLAYTMDIETDNILEVILTRIAWIVAPVFVYLFRYLLGGIFSKTVRMSGGGLMNSFRHPRQASQQAKQMRQDKAQQKEQARKERQANRQTQKDVDNFDKWQKKKDELNKVQPKNAQFSEERHKNSQPNASSKEQDKDKLNKGAGTRDNNENEPSGEKDGSNQQQKRRNIRSERVERPNGANNTTYGTGVNAMKYNQSKVNQPTNSSNQGTSDNPSNIRAERVKQAQDKDNQRQSVETKGKVNPTKNSQSANRKQSARTERTSPNKPNPVKKESARNISTPSGAQRINRQTLPKKMNQPTVTNKPNSNRKALQTTRRTVKPVNNINPKTVSSNSKINKQTVKFTTPKKK